MRDPRPFCFVAVITALALAGCAHAPTLRPSMALMGADGGWSGFVNGCEIRVRTEGGVALHLTDPMVVVGGTTVLYNSDTHDGRYISLDTEHVACQAAGRDYSQTAKGGLGPGSTWDSRRVTFTTTLDGCAAPLSGSALRRFARAQGLPAPDPHARGPRADIDGCRPGWRKNAAYAGALDRQ